MGSGSVKLNRNQLKYVVIAAMLIDHIAWAFVPYTSVLGQVMHFIGRLTGPTMAFFLAEGYAHTRSVPRYALRMGIFALLSWIPFSLFEYGTWPHFDLCCAGVIYTLFLGLLAIWLWDRAPIPKWLKVIGIVGLCILSLFGDWPVFDVLWPLSLYRHRDNPKRQALSFCIGGVFNLFFSFSQPFYTMLNALGVFLVPVILHFFYSGEPGSRKPFHKWFFYLFYPAHLFVLYLIQAFA